MVDCWHPKECALLIEILGAQCLRCYRRDPAVDAAIALHRAKSERRRSKMKAPRKLTARGLQDAKRARSQGGTTARGKTTA